MEAVMEVLLNNGVLGVVVLAMGMYVRDLHRERQQMQGIMLDQTGKRTDDAKMVASTILELAEKHAQEREQIKILLTEVSSTLSALDSSVRDWRQEVNE
tara:strand:+ start:249 stop:545 length:297 start_codon:yes stop_codon:yes gene_type:complete